VGNGAEIGAQSGVMRDVLPGERVVGCPAMPVKRFFRMTALLAKMIDGPGKNG
jgi:UDP-3-O-[3-hydroxymyristoyl] glucosamine N-acyltransferase